MIKKTLIPLDPARLPINVTIEFDRWGNMFAWAKQSSAPRRLIASSQTQPIVSQRLITPFELRVRYQPVQLTFQDILDTYLSPILINEELIKPVSYLKFIKPDSNWGSAEYRLPLEYGISFTE